jgi:hypothetical protein
MATLTDLLVPHNAARGGIPASATLLTTPSLPTMINSLGAGGMGGGGLYVGMGGGDSGAAAVPVFAAGALGVLAVPVRHMLGRLRGPRRVPVISSLAAISTIGAILSSNVNQITI